MSADRPYQGIARPEMDAGRRLRMRLHVQGRVQGVGFRPFVYRLAKRLKLTGWVCNSAQGVFIEIEGFPDSLDSFLGSLVGNAPPHARITRCESSYLASAGDREFVVRESHDGGDKSVIVLPDLATCADCLKEIFDVTNRRYRYPFTNCTNCGPRYSIIEALPYDRAQTTMKKFPMCEKCRAEYENPEDRRFHAQPNACPQCGPHLELWNRAGEVMAAKDDALVAACDYVKDGNILALKGLGGFQLIVDARDDAAVRRLRKRKTREAKPLALMYPNLTSVMNHCDVSKREESLLTSHRAPIVLLLRRQDCGDEDIAPSVAPNNPYLGVMLPYTPMHHLLMAELGFPVVATSGNLSDEPICIDEREAVERLGGIADVFLVHDRPIARQMDDSVVRIVAGGEQVIRSARGYAPTPLVLPAATSPALALGGHLKNSVAIAAGERAFLSQHIGDLDTAQAYDALRAVTGSLAGLYDIRPTIIARDSHPDYGSSRFARELGLPAIAVQHHYAHVLAGMLDNDIEAPALGVAWDGAGLGTDGTIWGGEFLLIDDRSFLRVAHMRHFRLPGGEAAVREPRRSALGMLNEVFGDHFQSMTDTAPAATFNERELTILQRALAGAINSPITSSVGRMFDAVASLLDICQMNAFEGQAAMMLGFWAERATTDVGYPFSVSNTDQPYIIDWFPVIRHVLEDIASSIPKEIIARKFHNALSEIIVDIARRIREKKVVLTGGCFQNKYLTERTVERLRETGYEPFPHRCIPPNDGGIAVGQIMALARKADRS